MSLLERVCITFLALGLCPQSVRGLDDALLAALARRSRAHLERLPALTCSEQMERVRYRERRSFVKKRRSYYAPGGSYLEFELPEMRFDLGRKGPVPVRTPRRVGRFPSAADWTRLFSVENQSWFTYRDLGTRLAGYDLVREIEFRGWLPFTDGRDIREWEGVALVEANLLQIVEVRARPRNQEARLAELYRRWARSWKIKFGLYAGPYFIPLATIRTARRPLAHHALLRFDERYEDLRLPTLVRYETRQAVSLDETVSRSVSTLRYTDCRERSDGGGVSSRPPPMDQGQTVRPASRAAES